MTTTKNQDSEAAAGCISAVVLGLLVYACSGSSDPTPLDQAKTELSAAENACTNAEIAYNQADGRRALGEWDQAAAGVTETVSPEQEWEIRKSLAREMGLAPSEVNGWKDIYRARAAQAKKAEAKVVGEIAGARTLRDQMCEQARQVRSRVQALGG